MSVKSKYVTFSKFLARKMKYQRFWIGIDDLKKKYVFRTQEGFDVSKKIFWAEGEPAPIAARMVSMNGSMANDTHKMAVYSGGLRFYLPFICQQKFL